MADLVLGRSRAFPSGTRAPAMRSKAALERVDDLQGPRAAGEAWLFTLGPKGGSTPGGSKVAEIGPVPPIAAPEYLLRVNYGSGPPGATTSVHSHQGSEAFYVISGQLSQRTPHGVRHVDAGQTLNGQSAGMPMEVSNSGTTDVSALIMFVVDATKPFSSPAEFP